jgi:hypothetical protein
MGFDAFRVGQRRQALRAIDDRGQAFVRVVE